MNSKLHENKRNEDQYVISYLTLRKSIGLLAIALPLVLLVGFLLLNKGCSLPPSISHYFYTSLGSYFTGTLCAVSLFLFSYNGPENADRRAAFFAAVCALFIVFFPTNPYCSSCFDCTKLYLAASKARNNIHYTAAGLLFSTLAYFSLILFTKTSEKHHPTKRKFLRNKIYKFCGWTIIFCILIIGITSIKTIHFLDFIKNFSTLTYVFESIALIAFGFSWLISQPLKTLFRELGKNILR
jgi:hypothetical protein